MMNKEVTIKNTIDHFIKENISIKEALELLDLIKDALMDKKFTN